MHIYQKDRLYAPVGSGGGGIPSSGGGIPSSGDSINSSDDVAESSGQGAAAALDLNPPAAGGVPGLDPSSDDHEEAAGDK